MRARDVMTTKVVSVREDTPVDEIARILFESRISGVPVLDADGNVVGIVSEGDLMRRPESGTDRPAAWWLSLLATAEEKAANYIRTHGKLARDVMTRGVISVDEDATVEEVAALLEQHRIKRVPVLRGGNLVGIVSRANLLRGLATAKATPQVTADDETIRDSIVDALRNEAGVRDQFIDITVSNGEVHLWGAAQSEEEKKAARLVAESTIGVRAVEDHLGVIPPNVHASLWGE